MEQQIFRAIKSRFLDKCKCTRSRTKNLLEINSVSVTLWLPQSMRKYVTEATANNAHSKDKDLAVVVIRILESFQCWLLLGHVGEEVLQVAAQVATIRLLVAPDRTTIINLEFVRVCVRDHEDCAEEQGVVLSGVKAAFDNRIFEEITTTRWAADSTHPEERQGDDGIVSRILPSVGIFVFCRHRQVSDYV